MMIIIVVSELLLFFRRRSFVITLQVLNCNLFQCSRKCLRLKADKVRPSSKLRQKRLRGDDDDEYMNTFYFESRSLPRLKYMEQMTLFRDANVCNSNHINTN